MRRFGFFKKAVSAVVKDMIKNDKISEAWQYSERERQNCYEKGYAIYSKMTDGQVLEGYRLSMDAIKEGRLNRGLVAVMYTKVQRDICIERGLIDRAEALKLIPGEKPKVTREVIKAAVRSADEVLTDMTDNAEKQQELYNRAYNNYSRWSDEKLLEEQQHLMKSKFNGVRIYQKALRTVCTERGFAVADEA